MGLQLGATLVTTRLEYYPGMAVAGSDVTLPFATSEACAQYLGVTRTWKGPDPKTGKPANLTCQKFVLYTAINH